MPTNIEELNNKELVRKYAANSYGDFRYMPVKVEEKMRKLENEVLRRMDDEWVSVEEKLPPTNAHVLVALESGSVHTTQRLENSNWSEDDWSITHWRELPEPPEK